MWPFPGWCWLLGVQWNSTTIPWTRRRVVLPYKALVMIWITTAISGWGRQGSEETSIWTIMKSQWSTSISHTRQKVKIRGQTCLTFVNQCRITGKTYPGLGIKLNLKRHLGYHLTQTYVPSILFVFTAWISFFVPSDVVPGRMVICVTTLLTLTSMFSSVR